LGVVQTETAELEEEALATEAFERVALPAKLSEFSITLGKTYYHDGMVNPGVEASKFLGDGGDPIRVSFSDGTADVTSSINRTANRSGGVRLVGKNALIADWFQRHFREGETVKVEIISPHWIMMVSPAQERYPSN
jgi:hypothetical protein